MSIIEKYLRAVPGAFEKVAAVAGEPRVGSPEVARLIRDLTGELFSKQAIAVWRRKVFHYQPDQQHFRKVAAKRNAGVKRNRFAGDHAPDGLRKRERSRLPAGI